MAPYRKNVMVGVVVLGGLVILGWMLIQFGGSMVTPFAKASLHVRFIADRADGISNGSAVSYRGVNIGRVERISRAPDQLRVYIDAGLDKQPPLPANVKAVIRSTGLIGAGASIVLETIDPAPQGTLQAGQEINAVFIGLDILPPEFAELAGELRATAKQFRDSQLVMHLDEQVVKTGKLIESMHSLTADQGMRDNLKSALDNIRLTTEKTNRIAENMDKFSGDLQKLSTGATETMADARTTIAKTQEQILSLSKQTSDRMEQIARLLDQFQQISEKVNKGQGTAGALVNDNRLYESMVDTVRQLNATVTDLRRVVQQWEQEGVSLKLK